MLLLYPGLTRFRRSARLHLHSTMLLLYRRWYHGKSKVYPIYIPLCFYFIGERIAYIAGYFNLHSTMLLLYPIRLISAFRNSFCIYIPLCFYFILRNDTKFLRGDGIYIPLCFYFIQKLTRIPPSLSWFTFHYASTLSEPPEFILTPPGYLHSTMLLLYPLPFSRALVLRVIYIPLCFYFIFTLWNQVFDWAVFTFHYASTLSIPREPLPLSAPSFTFHYASTLSARKLDHKRQISIYIPLCFYFIHVVIGLKAFCTHIYIPLCFYFIWKFDVIHLYPVTFTFHYASTLSARRRKQRNIWCIYIPLCFYFIPFRNRAYIRVSIFTFHYASTLSRQLFDVILVWYKKSWQLILKDFIIKPRE